MTMIEKVALALEEQFKAKVAASAGMPFELTGVTTPKTVWAGYARAALEAMREPTPEMLAAFVDGDDPGYTEDWQAMIDVALAEGAKE